MMSIGSRTWAFQRTHFWTPKKGPKSKMAEIHHLEHRHDIIFLASNKQIGEPVMTYWYVLHSVSSSYASSSTSYSAHASTSLRPHPPRLPTNWHPLHWCTMFSDVLRLSTVHCGRATLSGHAAAMSTRTPCGSRSTRRSARRRRAWPPSSRWRQAHWSSWEPACDCHVWSVSGRPPTDDRHRSQRGSRSRRTPAVNRPHRRATVRLPQQLLSHAPACAYIIQTSTRNSRHPLYM